MKIYVTQKLIHFSSHLSNKSNPLTSNRTMSLDLLEVCTVSCSHQNVQWRQLCVAQSDVSIFFFIRRVLQGFLHEIGRKRPNTSC